MKKGKKHVVIIVILTMLLILNISSYAVAGELGSGFNYSNVVSGRD